MNDKAAIVDEIRPERAATAQYVDQSCIQEGSACVDHNIRDEVRLFVFSCETLGFHKKTRSD